MEQKALQPVESSGQGAEKGISAIVQRRQAIQLFLHSPAVALQQYPALSDDLISFFSQSSNPHFNEATGLPAHGREADFEQWKAAQEWANVYLKR